MACKEVRKVQDYMQWNQAMLKCVERACGRNGTTCDTSAAVCSGAVMCRRPIYQWADMATSSDGQHWPQQLRARASYRGRHSDTSAGKPHVCLALFVCSSIYLHMLTSNGHTPVTAAVNRGSNKTIWAGPHFTQGRLWPGHLLPTSDGLPFTHNPHY